MKADLGPDDTPGVDMAPMIDCVFLLLIFFLVAATIRKKHNELPIELEPMGSTTEMVDYSGTIIITVQGKGDTFSIREVNQADLDAAAAAATNPPAEGAEGAAPAGPPPVDVKGLRDRLRAESVEAGNRDIVIQARSGTPYGKIAVVIDQAQMADFKRIHLSTL